MARERGGSPRGRTLSPLRLACALLAAAGLCSPLATATSSYHHTRVAGLVQDLFSADPHLRAAAAERLGYLRAYGAANALTQAARDPSPPVRREACLSLAWCGGRTEVPALLAALDDPDWTVRQAAWVALTNLTGMEFSFDAHGESDARRAQTKQWRSWWAAVPKENAPPDLLALLGTPPLDLAENCPVHASSTYKGPASLLTSPRHSGYWQTKNVTFPQHCTIDLGTSRTVGCLAITQYGKGFRMTDFSIATSRDGQSFNTLTRRKGLSPAKLIVPLPPTEARFVRITSHAAERATYPTTFHRVRVFENEVIPDEVRSSFLPRERALRAIGALGGSNAAPHVIDCIAPYLSEAPSGHEEKLMVQAGVRSLGRLGTPECRDLLIRFLDHPYWARYAADALGDIGDDESASALIAAYPHYALTLDQKDPATLPRDDVPGFEAVDRMYETPYAIALALSRFTFDHDELRTRLRAIAPLLVANMAGDFDGAMLYEEQAYQGITRYLLNETRVLPEIINIAHGALHPSTNSPGLLPGVLPNNDRQKLRSLARRNPGGTSVAAHWLASFCRTKDQVPPLLALLEHDNGWVRINVAKALMCIGDRSTADPIATILAASQPEAAYGYLNAFLFHTAKKGQDEYNAPSPCWREAFTRALGALGDHRHVPLLARLLDDERNVLEVRVAAAIALDQIGSPKALATLTRAATDHPFHSIRLLAREALWKRKITWSQPDLAPPPPVPTKPTDASAPPDAIVFIKGDNIMPNRFQIDAWRQTYSTTDSGPTYRLGRNLYLLTPATAHGKVTPLTHFTDGYVADCEVSWDGQRIIFARRDADAPWWHIHELDLQSKSLTQLTHGPYHDVQPAYLPDGRIVFSSSRTGMRDEYHGYPATGLTVMHPDGSGMHCIGFNLGRDNEPAVMPDGRIVFSRLELFYSRLKTEITVQTVLPDGTMNRTLYGPERRELWRNVSRQSGERGWGEAPPRHRVLRLTQPQPLDNQRIVVATTGGLTIIGPGPTNERIIPRHHNMAVTSPFPLDDETLLCAATVRDEKAIDLGLHTMDLATGALTLLYNDPATAEFEPRPVRPRPLPHAHPTSTPSNSYTANLLCGSAFTSRESLTRERGKLVRIIEGQSVPSRHHTHTSSKGEAWKNHVGTHARVLGTVPLAADGSFHVEIPADRLVHCQILDSDRRVVGNQLVWMSARPGETRSCVGCHEMPDTAGISAASGIPLSAARPPVPCLPTGHEFSYRAKAWQKGRLLPETEARTRTVNAVNLPARN